MTSQLITPELARAYQAYFRTKGGEQPIVPRDVLPVVILDDNSLGPYPAYRAWHAGVSLAAGAVGEFSYIGIRNSDKLIPPSAVVVDSVDFRLTVAADVKIGITNDTTIVLGGQVPVLDSAEEKETIPSDAPKIGNAQIGFLNSVGAVGTVFSPAGDLLPHRIDGPWTIGPNGVFLIRPGVAQIGIVAYFRGRYYPAL